MEQPTDRLPQQEPAANTERLSDVSGEGTHSTTSQPPVPIAGPLPESPLPAATSASSNSQEHTPANEETSPPSRIHAPTAVPHVDTQSSASGARLVPVPQSPTDSLGSDFDDLYDIEFDFWVDSIDRASIYDLLGSEWAQEAHRLLEKASRAIERIDREVPLSQSEESRKRRQRIREKLVSKVNRQWDIVESKLSNPLVTRKADKLKFFLGATNLWFSAFLIGMAPSWVPTWFTLKALVLLSLRWGIYRKKRWHYFLNDFCYLINALILAFVYVFPSSRTLFHVLYVCAHGPLAWAVVTWRNSLVFHSLDKMTSCFIHIAPAITLSCLRWLDPKHSTAASPYYAGYGAAEPLTEPVQLGLGEALVGATIIYAVWQVAYYWFVLHRRHFKVYTLGYATSFTWLLQDNGSIAKAMGVFGDEYRLITFMALQFVYSMVTVLPTVLWARSMILNILFLIGILSVSIWNASTFYFDVFSAKYARDLAKLEAEFKAELNSIGSPATARARADTQEDQESRGALAPIWSRLAPMVHIDPSMAEETSATGKPPGAWVGSIRIRPKED